MNAGQYEGIMTVLQEIRDRVPDMGTVRVPDRNDDFRMGASSALDAMMCVAKSWAEGAAENDEAMGRRDHRAAKDQPFFLADILNMINDAAREVGVTEIPVKL